MSCVVLTDHVTKSIDSEIDVGISDTLQGKSKSMFNQNCVLRYYMYLQFAMNDLLYMEKSL